MPSARALLALSLILCLPFDGNAQRATISGWSALTMLQPGESVEVKTIKGQKQKGRFKAVTPSSLTITVHDAPLELSSDNVIQVKRLLSKHVGKTTAIGAGVGAAAGAVTGAATGSDCSKAFLAPCFSRSDTALVGAVFFAICGAIAGLVVGLTHRASELVYLSTAA